MTNDNSLLPCEKDSDFDLTTATNLSGQKGLGSMLGDATGFADGIADTLSGDVLSNPTALMALAVEPEHAPLVGLCRRHSKTDTGTLRGMCLA